MAGLFVTFEGGEGSGKSTQIERLAARLEARGRRVLRTREPGGTPLGEGIRELLLDPGRRPGPLAEVFLLEAARTELTRLVIRPALAEGQVVLCDRYDDSTLAYQGGGRGLDLEELRRFNHAATGGLRPDVTLLFDLDPAVGLARRHAAKGGTNRIDREDPAFHARVRAAYLDLARAEPARWVTLDAARDPDDLEHRVWDAVAPRVIPAGA